MELAGSHGDAGAIRQFGTYTVHSVHKVSLPPCLRMITQQVTQLFFIYFLFYLILFYFLFYLILGIPSGHTIDILFMAY